MIFYAETPVPISWYKADYDHEQYPNFEFKFIKDCYAEKAHGIVFIKPVDGQRGDVLSIDNVKDCHINFPSHIMFNSDMEEVIENYGLYRLH